MRYFQRYEAFLVAFDRGTKGKRKGKGRKEEREERKKGGELTHWQTSGPGLGLAGLLFLGKGDTRSGRRGKEGRGGRKRRKGERKEGEKEGERGRRDIEDSLRDFNDGPQ